MSFTSEFERPNKSSDVSRSKDIFKFGICLRDRPIALASVWSKGGREIANSGPPSVLFTTLTHCLNTPAADNYFVWAEGKWFRPDKVLKGSVPLSPLCSHPEGKTGPNPRLENDLAPPAFYLFLYGLALTALSFAKMSRADVERGRKIGRGRFPG